MLVQLLTQKVLWFSAFQYKPRNVSDLKDGKHRDKESSSTFIENKHNTEHHQRQAYAHAHECMKAQICNLNQ